MSGCSKVQILVPAQCVNLHTSLKKEKKAWTWIVWKWQPFSWSLIPIEILTMPFLGGRWGSPLTSTACGNKSKQGIFDQRSSLTEGFSVICLLFHVWKKEEGIAAVQISFYVLFCFTSADQWGSLILRSLWKENIKKKAYFSSTVGYFNNIIKVIQSSTWYPRIDRLQE